MYGAGMLEKELVAASTEPLILSLFSKRESCGYEPIQEVKRLSDDKIAWTALNSVLRSLWKEQYA
jgi:hypothetical protein